MRDPVDRADVDCFEIGRLSRRADFLRVAKGKRRHAGAFSLQAAPSGREDRNVRIGFTLTRKVGNAVVRNRARRRLREAVRLGDDLPVVPGHDYVIVGRIEALRQPFADLRRDLARAVCDVHEVRATSRRPSRDERSHKRRSQEPRPKRTGPER